MNPNQTKAKLTASLKKIELSSFSLKNLVLEKVNHLQFKLL